jgi:hypothetical protein
MLLYRLSELETFGQKGLGLPELGSCPTPQSRGHSLIRPSGPNALFQRLLEVAFAKGRSLSSSPSATHKKSD